MLNTINDKIKTSFDVETLPYRRQMSKEEILKLRDVCAMAFGDDIHPGVIEKVTNYSYFTERHMKGRAAGNIEDLVIRYLFRYYASLLEISEQPNLCHMEIGVLFGAATISAHHATRLAEKSFPIVIVEPFEGYYGQQLDPTVKLPVTRDIFYENLDRFQIPHNDIVLVEGFSTDQKIVEACSKWKILSLLIDGDHSYIGVKNDWLYFSRFVVPGGFVLIDDYNNRQWPDINKFVNEELLPNLLGEWKVSLAYGRSIILEKTNITMDASYAKDSVQIQQLLERDAALIRARADFEKMEKSSRESISSLEAKTNAQETQLTTLKQECARLEEVSKRLAVEFEFTVLKLADTHKAELRLQLEKAEEGRREIQQKFKDAELRLQNSLRKKEQEVVSAIRMGEERLADAINENGLKLQLLRDELDSVRSHHAKEIDYFEARIQNTERLWKDDVEDLSNRMHDADLGFHLLLGEMEIRVQEEHKKYLKAMNDLRTIVNSFSWRMFSPLRKIKDTLFGK